MYISKVEKARSRPVKPAASTAASHKLETRRLQMLSKQRERLEEELEKLQREVEALVSSNISSFSVYCFLIMNLFHLPGTYSSQCMTGRLFLIIHFGSRHIHIQQHCISHVCTQRYPCIIIYPHFLQRGGVTDRVIHNKGDNGDAQFPGDRTC